MFLVCRGLSFDPVYPISFIDLNLWLHHPEVSAAGAITTLTLSHMEVANFCATMDTLIDQSVVK